METEMATNKVTQKSESVESSLTDKLIGGGIFSPLYLLFFIILFTNGKDGYDLHDAILNIIKNYGS